MMRLLRWLGLVKPVPLEPIPLEPRKRVEIQQVGPNMYKVGDIHVEADDPMMAVVVAECMRTGEAMMGNYDPNTGKGQIKPF